MNRIKQAFHPKQESSGSKKRFSLFSKDTDEKRPSSSEKTNRKAKNSTLAIDTADFKSNDQPRSANISSSAKDISPIQQHAASTLITEANNALITPAIASNAPIERRSSLRRGRSLVLPPRRKSTRVSMAISSANEKHYSLAEEPESSEPRDAPPPQPDDGSTTPQADEFLQLGLACHENGKLEKATHYWRMAAERDHPLGLFFYGIALRHGWGCKPNPTMAVRYLQRAAECAVYDLQTGIAQSTLVAKQELVLAIYELGVCFQHGWGVPKNIATAAYYFEIASNLGDPDAQNDLGFCYSHGQGVKKDNFKAAKYYRMADRQGNGIVGNSWIWKSKYDIVDLPNWDKSASSDKANTMAAVKSITSAKNESFEEKKRR
ncbi:unnamed protein product [Umbelopsis ramanniana]